MTQRDNGEALAADSAALSSAGSAAEEALALHRFALAVLDDGWRGESGSTAIDLVRRQCGEAANLVEALHGAAAELRALRDSLPPAAAGYDGDLVDAEGGYAQAPGYAEAAARLSDRAAPVFAAPAPPIPPAALTSPMPLSPAMAPAPAMSAWPSSPGSLPMPNLGAAAFPNLGSTVAGLVAQVADALSSDTPEAGSPAAATPDAEPVDKSNATSPPAQRETAAREPAPALPPQPPALPAAAVPPSRPDGVVPQQESAPSPLLAAELPPPPGSSPTPPPPEPAPPPGPAPAVAADTKTPCEIAADELPQVGQ